MKTLKDMAVEFQQKQSRPNAELAEMPGFTEWVKKALPCLAGLMIGKNGFNHGLKIAGQSYGSCTWQGDTLYTAMLNADCSITVFADDEEIGKFPISEQELVKLVSKKIGSSWHPHWKRWNVYHWGWDVVPTIERVAAWDAAKKAESLKMTQGERQQRNAKLLDLSVALLKSYSVGINPLPELRKRYLGTWEWAEKVGEVFRKAHGRSTAGAEARHPAMPVIFMMGSYGAVYAACNDIQSEMCGHALVVHEGGEIEVVNSFTLGHPEHVKEKVYE